MASPPEDYDLALYGDIGAAFDRLNSGTDESQLAGAAAAALPVRTPRCRRTTTASRSRDISGHAPPTEFAPRIFSPADLLAADLLAPHLLAADLLTPDLLAADLLAGLLRPRRDVRPDVPGRLHLGAQTQSLLAVSAEHLDGAETVSAATGNTQGTFYVRVQGHGDEDFDADVRST